jgi:NADH:ubiquinone oxidoreductase subunit 6 (subunit J)
MFNFIKTDRFNLNNSLVKWIAIVGWHLLIAVALAYALAYIFGMLLTYLGLVGELATHGIYTLWKKIGTFILPTVILALSILVITLSNPVYALVCLILVFFSTALFLLSIQVNFLALIYLIIYIGAIAILFLFVIMMFNLRELEKQSTKINDYSFISISFWFYFLIITKFYSLLLDYIWTYIEYDHYFNEYFVLKKHSLTYYITYQYLDSLLFGTLLYTYYCYLFLVAALILLTAMLGSIILALSTTEKTNRI